MIIRCWSITIQRFHSPTAAVKTEGGPSCRQSQRISVGSEAASQTACFCGPHYSTSFLLQSSLSLWKPKRKERDNSTLYIKTDSTSLRPLSTAKYWYWSWIRSPLHSRLWKWQFTCWGWDAGSPHGNQYTVNEARKKKVLATLGIHYVEWTIQGTT